MRLMLSSELKRSLEGFVGRIKTEPSCTVNYSVLADYLSELHPTSQFEWVRGFWSNHTEWIGMELFRIQQRWFPDGCCIHTSGCAILVPMGVNVGRNTVQAPGLILGTRITSESLRKTWLWHHKLEFCTTTGLAMTEYRSDYRDWWRTN